MTGVDPDPASSAADSEWASLAHAASLSLLRSLPDAVALYEIVYDAAGSGIDYRILYVNGAYETIFGIPRARAIGACASELYGLPPDLPAYMQVALSLAPVRFETIHEPLGKHLSVSAFSWAPGMVGAVYVDQSERHRLEDELKSAQRFEPLVHLARSVAHDFNNVLTAILGYTELLDGALDPGDNRRADVDEIRKAAQTAARLNAQLLALGRSDSLPGAGSQTRGPKLVRPG